MCDFFSLVNDGKGRVWHFSRKIRKKMINAPKDLSELRVKVEAMKKELYHQHSDVVSIEARITYCQKCIVINTLDKVLALIDGLIENLQRRAADYEKISRRLNNVKNHTDEDIALELRSVLGDEK